MSTTPPSRRAQREAILGKLDELEQQVAEVAEAIRLEISARAELNLTVATGQVQLTRLGDRQHRIANMFMGVRGEVDALADDEDIEPLAPLSRQAEAK